MAFGIIAILFLVVTILLAITSIALQGTVLYLTRKTVKSVSDLKLIYTHQGWCTANYIYVYRCATVPRTNSTKSVVMPNEYYMYMYVHTYIYINEKYCMYLSRIPCL